MKWKDFEKKIGEYTAQSREIGAQLTPIHRAESDMKNAHRRVWKLDEGFYAKFAAGYVSEWQPLGLSLDDENGGGARLTTAGLRRAMAVVKHIEDWIAGRIDELKPSGPWDKDVPS